MIYILEKAKFYESTQLNVLNTVGLVDLACYCCNNNSRLA